LRDPQAGGFAFGFSNLRRSLIYGGCALDAHCHLRSCGVRICGVIHDADASEAR
jgi:hypothetical protein